MKVTPKNIKTRKFQMGGPVEAGAPVESEAPVESGAPAEAPAAGGEQDPMMILFQMAAQALQGQDCQAAMQVCQALLEIAQQMSGGGAEPEPQSEPVFRKGGVLLRRIKK